MEVKNSIYTLNRILIVFFTVINGAFLAAISYSTQEEIVYILSIIDGIVNLALMFMYLFLNERFKKDFDIFMGLFKQFNDGSKLGNIPKSTVFIENSEIASVFKRAYIGKNILQKDIADLRAFFKKFIPKDIYNELGFKGYERLVLGDSKKKYLTVMFIDIVGFTSISETIDPVKSLMLLNIYFDGIGEIIYSHGGYIDKFLGDGIMIIFDHVHSDNALRCSIEIQDYIKKFQITTIGKKIGIGIGMNTGEVIMGTIGTKQRMDATIIGDTVNVASRLEGLTRKYKQSILMSKNTYDAIQNKSAFTANFVGNEAPEGKQNTIDIYSLAEHYNVTL